MVATKAELLAKISLMSDCTTSSAQDLTVPVQYSLESLMIRKCLFLFFFRFNLLSNLKRTAES